MKTCMVEDSLLLTSVVLFFLFDLQQALASGGFPIAVPLQANAINTQAQGGMTVNG